MKRLTPVLIVLGLTLVPATGWAEGGSGITHHDPNRGDRYGRDWHYCNDPAYRDCRGDGSGDNPEEGEHFCKKRAECRHYPPFASEESARAYDDQDRHGAHSGHCRDQGCQRHCDPHGCWNYDRDKRPERSD